MKRIFQAWLLLCLSGSQAFAGEATSAAKIAESRKAADQGEAAAQILLGYGYHFGDGLPKDDVESVKWFRKAAEQGDAGSQARLANHYETGCGVPKDDVEAGKWYKRAAEQGDSKAQFCLGWMYYLGKTVSKDVVAGYMWINLAGTDDTTIAKTREMIEVSLTPEQLAEARKLSAEWKPRKEGDRKTSPLRK